MGRSLAAMLLTQSCFALVQCQVQYPCDSFLRQFPSLSSFFQHCECRYGNGRKLFLSSAVRVSRSELQIPGVSFQHATGGERCTASGCVPCEDRRETAYVCKTDCRYVNGSDVTPVEGAATVRVARRQDTTSIHPNSRPTTNPNPRPDFSLDPAAYFRPGPQIAPSTIPMTTTPQPVDSCTSREVCAHSSHMGKF